MNNEVNKVTRDTMKEQIQETVYDVYSPTLYERQKDNGGLTDDDNIKTTLIDNMTLIVENIRSDDGVNVAEVVESGEGYKFDFLTMVYHVHLLCDQRTVRGYRST